MARACAASAPVQFGFHDTRNHPSPSPSVPPGRQKNWFSAGASGTRGNKTSITGPTFLALLCDGNQITIVSAHESMHPSSHRAAIASSYRSQPEASQRLRVDRRKRPMETPVQRFQRSTGL